MPPDLEKVLDTIRENQGVVAVDYTKSIYTAEEAFITRMHTFGGKTCSKISVVNICGSAGTNSKGTTVLDIEDFVCIKYVTPGPGDGYEYLTPPVYFIATPYSSSPVYITFKIDIKGDERGADLEYKTFVSVYSWNSNGEPAPHIKFNWHCCIQHVQASMS